MSTLSLGREGLTGGEDYVGGRFGELVARLGAALTKPLEAVHFFDRRAPGEGNVYGNISLRSTIHVEPAIWDQPTQEFDPVKLPESEI